MSRFIVLSGCSGGGKSSLLAELARRGHRVVEEPGRRIVVEEMRRNGTALPWIDMRAFLQRAIALAHEDLRSAGPHGGTWTFFDRGLVEAMAALAHATGSPLADLPDAKARPYHRKVFLVPPWPEIYVRDGERRHDYASATDEYARLLTAYPALGYDTVVLPKVSIAQRADLVLEALRPEA